MVATWSAAAWIIMRQFGVPGASQAHVETRIVRMQADDRSPEQLETLRDGRVMTLPIDLASQQDGGRGASSSAPRHWTNLN